MNDLADLTMFIINEFGEYIEGSDNPIDTTWKNKMKKERMIEEFQCHGCVCGMDTTCEALE